MSQGGFLLIKRLKKFLILFFAIAILGSGFLMAEMASGQTIQVPQTSNEFNWNGKDGYQFEHRFKLDTDDILVDIAKVTKNGSEKDTVTLKYTKKGSVSFWDFYNAFEVSDNGDEMQALSKRPYYLYSMNGFSNYYLIIDDQAKQVTGIYKSVTLNSCTNQSGANVSCPWKYYLVNANLLNSAKIYNNGQYININFDDKYTRILPDVGTNFYDYVSSTAYSNLVGETGDSCIKIGTTSATSSDYAYCFFPKGGKFENIEIKDNGNKPPTIYIPPKTFNDSEDLGKSYYGFKRPPMTFTLKYAQRSTGASQQNNVWFYFVATSPSYPNLAIRIQDCNPDKNPLFTIGDIESLSDDEPVMNISATGRDIFGGSRPDIYFTDSSVKNFANKVYKSGAGYPDCKVADIDWSDSGQLAKWGVDRTDRKEGSGEETCGIPILQGLVKSALAKVLCIILRGIGEAADWLIQSIFGTVFDAYHPPNTQYVNASAINPFIVQTAHADYPKPDASSIKQALGDPNGWVLTSWKIILGLADVFVVIVLLFLAIVNILHIQYDTYTIKKTLPTLIVGIILANFSIFITKMLVDAANVITATFMGGPAGTGVERLITAIIPTGTGTFMEATPSVGALILAILFGFFALIAFAILGFLFYIRYAVILTLTVAAPLAFVLMAFPPTQGLFKQWWGWYSKFIFMKPLSLFLVWLATLVLDKSGGAGITVWAIATFLVSAAIIVPFKLGGAIMGGWGAAGKWLSGTGKGGYLRKPVDSYIQAKKDAWKERANLAAERYTPLGRWRTQHEETMTGLKAERERRKDELKEQRRAGLGTLEEAREARRKRAKEGLERGTKRRTSEFYRKTDEGKRMLEEDVEEEIVTAMAEGRLKQAREDRTFDIYISGKAAEMGIPDYEASIANSEMRLEKIKDDQKYVIAYEKLNQHKIFTDANPLLDQAFKDVETAQMELSMAKPHERAAKQAILDAAQSNLDTQKAATISTLTATINPISGHNYTSDEATKLIDTARLQKYQQTRYFAITGKRQADDAATDAENYSPEATGADLYTKSVDPTTGRLVIAAKVDGVAYGPMAAKASDIENFTRVDPTTGKAVRLTNSGASGAIKGKINTWRKQMRDRTMKGAALQEHSNFLSIGNNELLEAATHQAWTSVSVRTKNEVLRIAIDNHIVPAGTTSDTITAEQLSTLIREHGLNTGEINQNAFADALISQLQKADGGTAIKAADGVTDVRGVTGLGQAAHWHAMNQ